MIRLNGSNCDWHEGMTVESLLKEKKFTYPRITIVINEKIIQPEEYSTTPIKNGDNVQVIHLMAGG